MEKLIFPPTQSLQKKSIGLMIKTRIQFGFRTADWIKKWRSIVFPPPGERLPRVFSRRIPIRAPRALRGAVWVDGLPAGGGPRDRPHAPGPYHGPLPTAPPRHRQTPPHNPFTPLFCIIWYMAVAITHFTHRVWFSSTKFYSFVRLVVLFDLRFFCQEKTQSTQTASRSIQSIFEYIRRHFQSLSPSEAPPLHACFQAYQCLLPWLVKWDLQCSQCFNGRFSVSEIILCSAPNHLLGFIPR